jgi:hypothetical protein
MPRKAGNYTHPTASALIRPDAGTQPQFRKKKKPATYRYDSSLAPDLNWDGKNPVREQGEHLGLWELPWNWLKNRFLVRLTY